MAEVTPEREQEIRELAERLAQPGSIVETIAGVRCPCGHKDTRHRKGKGAIGGFTEVMGKCRDCDCMGLLK